MIETRFDIPFVADLALREKQIQQNYRPVIAVHKWFARRPGTLFRALLLSEFVDQDLREAFYESHDLRGIAVCDPFMGGGTPLLEANRLGCDVVGTDINPMAYWIVREEIQHVDLSEYQTAVTKLRAWLESRLGHLYRTRCLGCGDPDAHVKYFIWVKTLQCEGCGQVVRLYPGHILAENRRHPKHVFICGSCGHLAESNDRTFPGTCSSCGSDLGEFPMARRGICLCGNCGKRSTYPRPDQGPPEHAMVAIEYVCTRCRSSHAGRFFKKPDADDLARYAEAESMLGRTRAVYIPDDPIPAGDETDRLHRWGYRRYREMFNARQLIGLELSCQGLMKHRADRIRRALATNLSDLLRYQNMLCRYDTKALKSLDVFSVHGFPVGLMQCESNLLGVQDAQTGGVIGSGGWLNIAAKYARAKAYCDDPFEVMHKGGRRSLVRMSGEWIGETRPGDVQRAPRRAEIRCGPAASLNIPPGSLDAVLTDPPYLANVQYAELMDFCYVWLRRLMGSTTPEMSAPSTRSGEELTGNATEERGAEYFTEGLSASLIRAAEGLKLGAPLVFTFHHNRLEAYYPVAVALLDARLVCTVTLPCPAEMGASIHINGTGSSIVDSVFVCRRSGRVKRSLFTPSPESVAELVAADVVSLRESGMKPTVGDIRCIAFGHLARIVVWHLRSDWRRDLPVERKLASVAAQVEQIGWSPLQDRLATLISEASPVQKWAVRDDLTSYGGDDEVVF